LAMSYGSRNISRNLNLKLRVP